MAARSSAKPPVAPAPTSAPPAGPATVESLGQQLREVLPARRLHSVSLCDHEANVLWLSEGALGPDEHTLVVEALDKGVGQRSGDPWVPGADVESHALEPPLVIRRPRLAQLATTL